MLGAVQQPVVACEITFPDVHHVNAAMGWLELGAPADAALELDKATFKTLAQPEVVILRWKICAKTNNWQLALYLARTLVRIAPEKPSSWLCLAFSLVNAQGAFDAWHELLEAARLHPRVSAVPVFLSRVCAQMAAEGGSSAWLQRWEQLEREAAHLKEPSATAKADPALVTAQAGGKCAQATVAKAPRISF